MMISVSFEQLCAFVAIRKTQDTDEVIRQLLLHVLELFPDIEFHDAEDFQQVIATALGLDLTSMRIQGAIDSCLGRGELLRKKNGILLLKPEVQSEIRS